MLKDHLIGFFLRHTKFYDLKRKSLPTLPSGRAEDRKKENSTSSLGCRHVVAFMGFMVFVFLNTHRMNMAISIVAMVNNSATVNNSLRTSESCPTLPQAMKNFTSSYSEQAQGDFNWSPELQGYIVGSGFVGYLLTQLIAGKLSEMFGCKWIIFWGMLFSSLANLVTPFVSWWNVYILIAVQTVRGMGQGGFMSSISVLGANWFPRVERGTLFAVMMSGNGAGVLVGGLISGYLSQASFAGWPVVFYSCGAAGIIFAFFFALFVFENPSTHTRISENELKFILSNQENTLSHRRPDTPWGSILTSVPVYALSFAIFGQFWGGTHFLTIHPTFLGTILHFPMSENGLFSSLPFLLQTVFTIIASMISNALNKKNYASVNVVRKFWNFMSCFGYSSCLIGIYFSGCNKVLVVVFSFLAMACLGFSFAGAMIVAADMTPTFAGTLMGLASTIGSTSGFILPFITGILTDHEQTLEQWSKILFISVGVVMSSGLVFCLFGSAEVQSWNYVEEKVVNDVVKQKSNP